jgi:hypothetical protein
VADSNKGLAEKVEVFARLTSDVLQKALGEVLAAKCPWQLLWPVSCRSGSDSRALLLGIHEHPAQLQTELQRQRQQDQLLHLAH